MFLCSIYVQNLQQAVYGFCKFCVLCCVVLFTFVFNLFVTNESMYIVMMIEKKNVLHVLVFFFFQKTVSLGKIRSKFVNP